MKAPFSLLLFLLLSLLYATVAVAVPAVGTPAGQGRAGARPKPKPPPSHKYFQEPGNDTALGHYDARYFRGVVPYEEHRLALRHLVRAYLAAFRELGLETWLAHGTLLGWWWSGRIMPWDSDMDVQVSAPTMAYLAARLNGTEHEYAVPGSGGAVKKRYLLDVNPHHADPGRGDGANVIDARWVDLANGLYIDITALAERNPAQSPGVWSDKNFHRYRARDLFPSRETEFEGVPAAVPYAFDRVLTEEYGVKSLAVTEFSGHRWDAELKEWVMMAPPPEAAAPTEMAHD